MNERKAKRMAARILKVGETKIWISPENKDRVAQATTKEDIRGLIKERAIAKRRETQHSRGSARVLAAKKAKGRRKGSGKRQGTKKTRTDHKRKWIGNVRAQRRVLKELKKSGIKFNVPARKVYMLITGNYFRGKNYVRQFVEGGKK